MIAPFSSGLVLTMPITVEWISQPPAATSEQASSIVAICRIGWLKTVMGSDLGFHRSLSARLPVSVAADCDACTSWLRLQG